MAWIKLSDRYLNLDSVVQVMPSTRVDGALSMEVATRANYDNQMTHYYFRVDGEDAEKLKRALDAASVTEEPQESLGKFKLRTCVSAINAALLALNYLRRKKCDDYPDSVLLRGTIDECNEALKAVDRG